MENEAGRPKVEAERIEAVADRVQAETERLRVREANLEQQVSVVAANLECQQEAIAAAPVVGFEQLAQTLEDLLQQSHREQECSNDPQAADMVKAILAVGPVLLGDLSAGILALEPLPSSAPGGNSRDSCEEKDHKSGKDRRDDGSSTPLLKKGRADAGGGGEGADAVR